MTRTTLGTLLAVALAAPLAWHLGGRAGAGVLAGVLSGASVAALGALWLRHALAYRPERALRAALEGFLFKLAMLFLGGFAFRYVDAAAARVDWKTFLVAFAVAALGIMALGLVDNFQQLKGEAPPRGSRLLEEEHVL